MKDNATPARKQMKVLGEIWPDEILHQAAMEFMPLKRFEDIGGYANIAMRHPELFESVSAIRRTMAAYEAGQAFKEMHKAARKDKPPRRAKK